MGCYFLLQEIFPTQGSNQCLLHLLHWQVGSLPLAPPRKLLFVWAIPQFTHSEIVLWKVSYRLFIVSMGFPGGTSGKAPACQCRRCKRGRFDPWVGKIPWRRAQQLTPVFLSGESYRQRSLVGYGPKSQTRLKRLSTHSYNEHQLCTKSRCKSWDPAENKPKAPTS